MDNKLFVKGTVLHPNKGPKEIGEKFKTATITTKVVCGPPPADKTKSPYIRAKKAKAHIHEVNRLGWPDTKESIWLLLAQMGEDEQTICYCGRFVKRWDGWHFQFPSTDKVIQVMEGLLPRPVESKFVEDMEG